METNDLLLRNWQESDALSLYEMCLDYGFGEQHASVIAAWVRSHNKASARVLEKCAFTFEGRLRRHARDKSDTLCYSILKEDWLALHSERK